MIVYTGDEAAKEHLQVARKADSQGSTHADITGVAHIFISIAEIVPLPAQKDAWRCLHLLNVGWQLNQK